MALSSWWAWERSRFALWREATGKARAVFLPRPRLILLAGALVSLVISVQLAQPILQPVFRLTVEPTAQAVPKLFGLLLRYLPTGCNAQHPLLNHVAETFVELPSSLARVPGVTGADARGAAKGWAVFWYRNENLMWLCRSCWWPRCSTSFSTSGSSVPTPHRERHGRRHAVGHVPCNYVDFLNGAPELKWRDHRKVAELTLPWAIYRVWLPTAAISVNLGFDSKLGAGQVVQAMLVGLREAYQKTFTSWTCRQANIRRIGAVLALVVLTTLVGDAWFHLPGADDIASPTAKTTTTGTAPASRVSGDRGEVTGEKGARRASSSASSDKSD